MNPDKTNTTRTMVVYRTSTFEDYKKGILSYDGVSSLSLAEEDGTVVFSTPLDQIKFQKAFNLFFIWNNNIQYYVSPCLYLAGQGSITKKERAVMTLVGYIGNNTISKQDAKHMAYKEAYNKDKDYYESQMTQWNKIFSEGGGKRKTTAQFALKMFIIFIVVLVAISLAFIIAFSR